MGIFHEKGWANAAEKPLQNFDIDEWDWNEWVSKWKEKYLLWNLHFVQIEMWNNLRNLCLRVVYVLQDFIFALVLKNSEMMDHTRFYTKIEFQIQGFDVTFKPQIFWKDSGALVCKDWAKKFIFIDLFCFTSSKICLRGWYLEFPVHFTFYIPILLW